jgi:UDP-N-acetylmuramate: L-alanyl-gamma-D-glutamyl-meso-diaminopimelate ligase
MDKYEYFEKKLRALPDSAVRVFDRPKFPSAPTSFHIIGVCGTAMGALAGLLKEKGYRVSGSDTTCYPPISTMLETLDVKLHVGEFDADHIPGADVVVVGNVARPTNVEAVYAREHQLPQATLPEVLRTYVFGDATRIVVAGTHGKTTTTGLMAHVFETAEQHPGYMIGGVPQGGEHGYALGSGTYAIFEGDEYDTSYYNKMPKFLQYGAHTGIVTSIELDHVDIYADFDDYKKAFSFFAQDIPEDGFLFVNGDSAETRALAEQSNAIVYTYGLTEESDFYATNIIQRGSVQQFDLMQGSICIGSLETPLSGTYNVANAVAVSAAALMHGITFEKIAAGVRTFTGMKRRQEVVGEVRGILVLDDFAHHPTAVVQTLAGIKKKYPDRRLVVLFEPRSNSSRKKVFEEAYTQSFDDADLVWIKVPPFREGDVVDDVIDAAHVAGVVTDRGTPMRVVEDVETLVAQVVPVLHSGDVVVTMSNGSFDGVQQKLLARLKEL